MKAAAGFFLAFAFVWIKAAGAAGNAWPSNTIGEKPFGVLLLGAGGTRDWKTQLDMILKRAGNRYPVEFAAGLADGKEMQRGIDALAEARVRTIVVVPLFVSSSDEVMDQNRFLLGIREKPSQALLNAPHAHAGAPAQRLRSRVPLVVTKALDDHPLFVDLLASRAKTQSRHPEQESVLLVGPAPLSRDAAKEWTAGAAALAEKVRQKGGFAAAGAYALSAGPLQSDREKSEAGLAALAKELGRKHHVIVVPLSMTGGDLRVNEALDGLFVKYDGRAILPDERIAQWVDQSAAAAAKLPDMRMFKDMARAGLRPPTLTPPPALAPPPALPRQGDKKQ